MDQNFFTQNPAFQNISPEKLAFLMNFMNQEKPDSSRDMMTFLMSFVTKARNQNLSFTTDEIPQNSSASTGCCRCCAGKSKTKD